MQTRRTNGEPWSAVSWGAAFFFVQALCSPGAARAEEPRVQDVAIASPWVVGSPNYSDVLMRSITVYDGTRSAKDQDGLIVYPNAKTAAAEFHITDITWSYVDPRNSTHKEYVSHFAGKGIPFGLSIVVNRSTTTPEGREMAMRNLAGDYASRGFDGMIFSCRNRKSLIDFTTTTIINQIAALPSVAGDNTAYVHLDDPGIHDVASRWTNRGCFCDQCAAKFASRYHGGAYHSIYGYEGRTEYIVSTSNIKGLSIVVSPPNDDYRAFLAFARDSDQEYAKLLTRTVKQYYPGRNVVFSFNAGGFNAYNAPNPNNIGLYSALDFWLSEVEVAPNHSQQPWFFTLNNFSKEYGKKYVTTSNSSKITPADYRRIIAGSYAVGINYIVPWDVYIASSVTSLRYFAKKEEVADLYGYIRGLSTTLDGYEDAYAASAVAESTDAVTDDRLAGAYANIPPVKIESAHEKLYAFVRAKPGDAAAPVAVHVVDWSLAPQSSTVTVDRSRFFPNKQLDIQWLTPKPYDATVHDTAQTTKNYSLLVASVSPTYSWDGRDTVKIFLPPATPWGTLVVRPMAVNPPANVRVSTVTARGAQLEYDANDNPAGTEYRIFLSSTGVGGTYFQALSTTSLSPQVSGLTPNTPYHARVRAVQAGGALSWSAVMAGSFRTLNNFVLNPGFEDYVTATTPAFWGTTGAASRVKRSQGAGDFHGGTAGLVIQNATGTAETFQSAGVQPWDGYVPGKTYRLTFWGKVGSESLQGGVGLIMRNGAGAFQSTLTDLPFDITDWTKYAVTFSTDAVVARPFELRAHNMAPTVGGTIHFDDISIEEVDRPTGPPGAPGTVTVLPGQGALTVSWGPSTGGPVDAYRIYVSTNAGFTSHLSGWNHRNVGEMTSVVVRGLGEGTTYYVRLRAQNFLGGVSGYTATASATTPADATAPSRPENPAIAAGNRSVSLSWSPSTDTGGSGLAGYRVDLSTDAGFGGFVAGWQGRDVGLVVSTSAGGLEEATNYYARLRAVDGAGNASIASVAVTTRTVDATAPTVAITAPAHNSVYTTAQTVTIQSAATDNVAVTKVWFIRNGVVVSTDTAAPYEYGWSVTGAANGAHNWTARAFDAAGHEATSAAVNLTVDIDVAGPTVGLTSPGSGVVVRSSQTVAVTAAATDDKGVAKVWFLHNGVVVSTDTTAPYEHAWAVGEADNGAHVWTARAFDAAGNEATSVVRTVTVDIRNLPKGVEGGRAYPVPYRANSGAPGMTFDRLPEGTRIRIFAMDGRLVRTLRADGYGAVVWGLDSEDGGSVASGVYVVEFEGNGSRKITRVIVQK